MRSRKLLALLFCLITFPAIAGYMTLLGAGVGNIAPIVSWVSTTDPTFPSSSLTFSRTSLATMFDSTGKLTYAPNNLLTQSNTFSNAAWVKSTMTVTSGVTDPLGGTNAFTLTATGPTSYIYQSVTGNASTTYMNTLWMKRRTGSGTVRLDKPDGATANAVILTGSWQQFYVTGLGAAANVFQQILIATSGDAVDIYFGTLSAVTYETTPRTADQVITTASAYYGPRIDYDPNTLAVKGLLIEEARTNLAINSASLSSFSPFSMTATTNFAVAPDGTSAATKLDDGTTAAVPHQVAYSPSGLSASTAYAFSVFAKQGTGRYLTLSNVGSSSADGGYAVFDLQAGTVTQSAALGAGSLTSATITPINGGWYRLSVVAVAGTNTARFLFVLGSNSGTYTADSNGRNSYTGTNNTWLVWGAQLELGSFATSYIPTGASSVTRAADVVQFAGAALAALQGSAWSAAVQFADVASYAGNPSIFDTSSNLQTVFMNGNKAAFFPTSLNTANGLSVLASHRIAASATRSGGRSIVSDGGTVATDATAMTSPPNTYLGSNVGAGNFLNGHVASFAIYNQRLSDATLQAKSVVGASY